MAGQWISQNMIIPGVYVNFKTSAPLSITPGDRGTVALLQEMSSGSAGDMYTITLTDQTSYPQNTAEADKALVTEILKCAKTVVVYNLGDTRSAETVNAALRGIKAINFDVLCYPYSDESDSAILTTIASWVRGMCETEGICIQAVLSGVDADHESIINVVQSIMLDSGVTLAPAQVTAWVAGAAAGARVNQSLTGAKYAGAVDVSPRYAKKEMETMLSGGNFIFKVDKAQNVKVVSDINSLTTVSADKGKMFQKNRVVRCLQGINNDITEIFESNFIGRIDNNADGRSLFKGMLVDYFNELQEMHAIQNFAADDVDVAAGKDSDAVVVNLNIQPVDSIEKIYISVNLS